MFSMNKHALARTMILSLLIDGGGFLSFSLFDIYQTGNNAFS
jgi:hypothetical protein